MARTVLMPAGTQIQVVLGSSASDFLLVVGGSGRMGGGENKADGRANDERRVGGAIPQDLVKKLRSFKKKRRTVSCVDFGGPSGAWFLCGEKSDGSNHNFAKRPIPSRASQDRVLVAAHGSRNGKDSYLYVDAGKASGHVHHHNVDPRLVSRIQRGDPAQIRRLRLFHDGSYFISDGQGVHCHTQDRDLVCAIDINASAVRDVAVAENGAWVVLHRHGYEISDCGKSDIIKHLQTYYDSWERRLDAQTEADERRKSEQIIGDLEKEAASIRSMEEQIATRKRKFRTIFDEISFSCRKRMRKMGHNMLALAKSDQEKRSECVICQEKDSDHACVPCGHHCVCATCAKLIRGSTCPICRAQTDSIIKIFGRAA